MNRNRTTIIILISVIILEVLFICGVIGYINDSGRVSPPTGETDNTIPSDTPAAIDLVYCSSPASLCVISFGQDNAGNMLIVIRNSIPGLDEFYAKLNPSQASDLYPCQKVQFVSDLYYCLGSQISDGTMVTMEVYSKNDNQLVASGRLPVSLEATPVPITTVAPTGTIAPTVTQTSTAQP